jgi:hypothetical protein
MKRVACLSALALLAGGCAELQQSAGKPPAEPAPEEVKIESQPLKHLKNRTIKPQPTRPLNVRSRCSHRDAVGTLTKLDLLVKQSEVKAFDARVTMKEHGSCSFRLADFKQVETMPQALLQHRTESSCTARLWEQGARVTIAFNSCPKSCEGDAFSYLWPIMVEAKSGRCF